MKLRVLLLSLVLLFGASLARGQATAVLSLSNSIVGQTMENNTDSGNALQLVATPVTTGSAAGGYHLLQLNIWTGAPDATATTAAGIYTSVASTPTSLMCGNSFASTTLTTGLNNVTPTSCSTVTFPPNTQLWLTQGTSSNSQEQALTTSGTCPGQTIYSQWSNGTIATMTLPSTFPPSHQAVLTNCYEEYAVFAPVNANVSFGNSPVLVTSVARSVTLSNTGNATLTISSINVAGIFTSDFSQSNNCGSSLAADSSCIINVNFTPQSLGFRYTTLQVTDNASGSPQSINLMGTGTHDIIVYWTASNSSGVVGYNIYRGTSSNGESATPLNQSLITSTSYIDTTAVAGTKYWYFVEANNGINGAASSQVSGRIKSQPIIIVTTD